MAGLAFDGSPISAPRQRFGDMARTQAMRGVGLLQPCRTNRAFDNPIDGPITEAPRFDAPAADGAERGIIALMLELGSSQPAKYGRNSASRGILSLYNNDCPSLPLLIR